MGEGNYLALVTGAQSSAAALKEYLAAALGYEVFSCDRETVRARLGRHTPGLLVLTALEPDEVEPVRLLVQEAQLQQWPLSYLIVQGEAVAAGGELARLDPYVAGRLTWPADAVRLAESLRKRADGAQAVGDAAVLAPQAEIGRRLLTNTPSLLPLVERVALAAVHDVTVLLTGETGTGKTFLGRLIHDCSPRREHPFVVVPCGAQPANLVESAFFGHVKGAFTGADRNRVGKFAAAGEGTILLDDIDTLGVEQQAGLLRVIETGEYEPVGTNETHVCRARIIVTSNRDPDEAVREGLLREDLYYRLNVMSFHLPPLRERLLDIPPLVRGLTGRFNTKFRKDLFEVSPEAMAALEAFSWPGNIRQLENIIQQAVLASRGPWLAPEYLPEVVRECLSAASGRGRNGRAGTSLLRNRETFERQLIESTLMAHNYSRSRAARALGISRVTLYNKIKKYGLPLDRLQPGK
jgi:DNA-binding NtrC family response regulator